MQKYVSLLERLNEVNINSGMKLSLENISQMAKRVGNPEKSINFIHVAGTNGKGSVCKKLQKIFQNSGYKCGLYTSPHLFTFRERILINEEKIPQEAVTEYLETLFNMAERYKINISFFEYLTLVAFMHYKQQKVDLAVLETGMGGIIDATNYIEQNISSVITSIDLDHTEYLGTTIQEIAGKKAGIIKSGSPTIIGPNAKPYKVFQDMCAQKNSPLFIVDGSEISDSDYNLENNLIVEKTVEIIKNTYSSQFQNISEDHIKAGLQAQQMCRLEPIDLQLYEEFKQKNNVKSQFSLYFDVGHNPIAFEKTMQRLRKMHGNKKVKIFFGTSFQKDCIDTFKVMAKYCDSCYLIEADHYRSMEIEQLINTSDRLSSENENWTGKIQPVQNRGNIQATFDRFFKISEKNNTNQIINTVEEGDIVLVAGSFFLMREVRQYFGYCDEKDPMELNERVIPKDQLEAYKKRKYSQK